MTRENLTWPRGANSRRFAIKTCDGVRITSCCHPQINIADDDFFSKIQTISCLSLFKLQWVQNELKKRKIRRPDEICYLSSILYLWIMINKGRTIEIGVIIPKKKFLQGILV